MDGQNFQNDQNPYYTNDNQNTGSANNNQSNYQNNYYQDNTYMQPSYSSVEEVPATTPTLAIISLIMGILSILLGCCYGIGIIFGIPGIIMAVIAGKQNKSGVGTAGLVCSIIGTVISVFMLLGVAAIIVAALADSGMYY